MSINTTQVTATYAAGNNVVIRSVFSACSMSFIRLVVSLGLECGEEVSFMSQVSDFCRAAASFNQGINWIPKIGTFFGKKPQKSAKKRTQLVHLLLSLKGVKVT